MIEQLLLISTCGTSLLTHGVNDEDRKWLTKIANDTVANNPDMEPRLQSIVAERRERLKAADKAERRKMSAELNGIEAVLERYKPKRTEHILVHTDTASGTATAELVQEVLNNQATLISECGLQTKNLTSFREALAELTKKLDELVQEYHSKKYFVVFNLTGGFKALNGYLQTLAMISADRCVFLFEGSSELMEIPRLPVKLAELDELRKYSTIFRRIEIGYSVPAKEAEGIPETLLMVVGEQVMMSTLGEVAWSRHRAKLFEEELLPTLSTRIRISDSVKKTFETLEKKQKIHVNDAMDDFSAHLDNNRALLKAHKFDTIKGNPVPGSTHELYAWSDGAAGRLFGHYENGIFVFDKLGKHL